MSFMIFICGYMLRAGFTLDKIYRLACLTLRDLRDKETILKWLKPSIGDFCPAVQVFLSDGWPEIVR